MSFLYIEVNQTYSFMEMNEHFFYEYESGARKHFVMVYRLPWLYQCDISK
jgi:hypothetical protein